MWFASWTKKGSSMAVAVLPIDSCLSTWVTVWRNSSSD